MEYRTIHEGYGKSISSWNNHDELETSRFGGNGIADLLGDITTCARTLGYMIDLPRSGWAYGKGRELYDHAGHVFMHIRLFKNGNVHMKFNQAFIK